MFIRFSPLLSGSFLSCGWSGGTGVTSMAATPVLELAFRLCRNAGPCSSVVRNRVRLPRRHRPSHARWPGHRRVRRWMSPLAMMTDWTLSG